MLETVSRRHQQPGSTLSPKQHGAHPDKPNVVSVEHSGCLQVFIIRSLKLVLFLNIFCISISWLLSSLESNYITIWYEIYFLFTLLRPELVRLTVDLVFFDFCHCGSCEVKPKYVIRLGGCWLGWGGGGRVAGEGS